MTTFLFQFCTEWPPIFGNVQCTKWPLLWTWMRHTPVSSDRECPQVVLLNIWKEMGQLLPGFFFGGGDWGQKCCQSPHRHLSPLLDQGLFPPSQGSSLKTWKINIYFCVKFDYFQAQKYLKKLYFMLKIAKNGLNLHKVGSFGFSRIFS